MTGQVNRTSEMVKTISSYIDAKGQVTNKEKELETLFDEVSYFNSGSEGAKEIQEQIDKLTKGIEALKKEADEIQSKIDDANLKIDEKASKLADIVSDINGATSKHQESIKKAAADATSQAINSYKANPSGFTSFEACFKETFDKKLRLTPVQNMNAIKQLYVDYQATQSSITDVSGEIEAYINQVNGLENKLKNTNATANLLKKTKDNLATTMTDAYKNVDTDSNVPHYSGKKEQIADEILNGNYKTDLLAGNAAASASASTTENAGTNIESAITTNTTTDVSTTENANANTNSVSAAAVSKEETLNKWLNKKTKNEEGVKVDKYRVFTEGEAADESGRVGNKELNSFGEALNNGMWEDLQAQGMSSDEIMTWISENWNIGLSKKDGKWDIPVGHGKSGHQETNSKYLNDATGSSKIYKKLGELCNSSKTLATADSLNQANVSRLKDAMSQKPDVLTKMYENGFSFKEALYLLTKAFPDAGVTYDLNAQNGERTYSIVKDSDATGNLYSDMENKINTYWGISKGAEEEVLSDEDQSEPIAEVKADPITFQMGNKTYTFIQDRNGDNKFSYTDKDNNDLLGSKDGIAELKAYDTDGNGKIEGDELKNLVLMENKQDESIASKDDVDKYKDGSNYKEKGAYTNAVDFNVSYTTAADLGITSIDLTSIQEGQEGYKNANDSDVLNTFKMTMKDGSTINARETNDTESHLNTFYKQVADNAKGAKNNEKISSAISHEEFTKAMSLDNPYDDNVSAIKDQVDSMKKYLNEALGESKQNGADPEQYNLNISWEQFKEMYGEDGRGGKYLQGAKKVASAKAQEHMHDVEIKQNISATDYVKERMDEYAEENKVKIKKEDKKEDNNKE